MEYVDLLFCHRPDPNTPIEETVRAMNHLIDHGKVFYWGTSEWSAEELQEVRLARGEHGRRFFLLSICVVHDGISLTLTL